MARNKTINVPFWLSEGEKPSIPGAIPDALIDFLAAKVTSIISHSLLWAILIIGIKSLGLLIDFLKC